MQLNNPILSLRVAKFNDEPVAEPITVEFGPEGGTIGRASDCTLVLPDQQRAISRIHARVEFRAGEYLLCDLGSNPSVLNERALGGTREARLADGDRVLIGTYLLEVGLAERGSGAQGLTGSRDPLASAGVLGGLSTGAVPGDPFGPGLLDPLGPPERMSTQPGFAGSESDHVSPELQAFSLPVPASPQSAAAPAAMGIPADYDPLAEALSQWESHHEAASAPPAPLQMPAPVSPLPAAPAYGATPASGPTGLPSSLLDGTTPGSAPTPFDDLFAPVPAARAAPPADALVPAPVPAPVPPPAPAISAAPPAAPASNLAPAPAFAATPAPAAALRPATATDSAVFAALLEGLQLDPTRAPNLPAADLARLTGAMLREALRGAMAVLRSRSMTKREARLDVTLIVARDNNPLKFFPDVDGALAQMLTGGGAGYLPPAEALERAFMDIESHELAVIAGMRAALAHVLTRFDPAQIEAQLDKPGVMDKVLSSRKAKLWDRFVETQAGIAHEAEDDFQKLFGKAFNDAYEAQIDTLAKARGRGKPDAPERR